VLPDAAVIHDLGPFGGCYYADACTLKACPSPRWYLRL